MKKRINTFTGIMKGLFALENNGLALAISCFFPLILSCSSIDCPMNNRVYTQYSLRTPDGEVDTLKMVCTISTNRTDGSDSVLINKDINITQFSLPISNAQPRDSFFVDLSPETAASEILSAKAFAAETRKAQSTIDTIVVSKEDHMHFESTDCAASYFHNITNVSTTHHAIDSVVIKKPEVTYDTSKNHFYIYFTPRR